jgi:predicted short-subunit dehydrogenase-like oxidoreductase (DUF2520 family)
MNAVIIGSGNVATVMVRLMQGNGINVLQLYSRNNTTAKTISDTYNVPFTTDNGQIDKNANFYLLCVSDASLNENLSYLKAIEDKPIFHTAAAVSKDILKNISSNYGVIYPLQSLRKEMSEIPKIPFLIDASNETTEALAIAIAEKIGNKVVKATDAERLKIHVAAVWVNNFTNHLFTLAEEYCNKEGLDFNLLKPLIAETANRAINTSPALEQTGPAIRKDHITLEKHLQVLNQHPDLKELYLTLSNSIINHQR